MYGIFGGGVGKLYSISTGGQHEVPYRHIDKSGQLNSISTVDQHENQTEYGSPVIPVRDALRQDEVNINSIERR